MRAKQKNRSDLGKSDLGDEMSGKLISNPNNTLSPQNCQGRRYDLTGHSRRHKLTRIPPVWRDVIALHWESGDVWRPDENTKLSLRRDDDMWELRIEMYGASNTSHVCPNCFGAIELARVNR